MPRGRVQSRFLTTGEGFPVQEKIEQVNDQHPVIVGVCVQTVPGDDDLGEGSSMRLSGFFSASALPGPSSDNADWM